MALDLTDALTGAFFTFSTFVVFGVDAFLTAVAFFAGLFFAGAFEAVGLALMPTDFLTGVEFFKGVFLAVADFGVEWLSSPQPFSWQKPRICL